uniref:Uncharacterized protein n=1 Tax=Pipistrellus kuhlii TaxID=59472 RepID=A0A7J7TLE5_PIPKU|nr:hypothetical protein mPipKuh1_009332 [Pipistrellus kuhlii]
MKTWRNKAWLSTSSMIQRQRRRSAGLEPKPF